MNEMFKYITTREWEVLDLIMAEKSNLEIGEILSIDIKTVEAHRRGVMKKLKAKNAVALTKKYFGFQK